MLIRVRFNQLRRNICVGFFFLHPHFQVGVRAGAARGKKEPELSKRGDSATLNISLAIRYLQSTVLVCPSDLKHDPFTLNLVLNGISSTHKSVFFCSDAGTIIYTKKFQKQVPYNSTFYGFTFFLITGTAVLTFKYSNIFY